MDPRNPRVAVSVWELMEPRVALAVWEPIVMCQRDPTDLRVVVTIWELRKLREPWEPRETKGRLTKGTQVWQLLCVS